MESGRQRSRRQHSASLETIDVQWTFTEDQYEAFEIYFHIDLDNGSLPFRVATYSPSDTPGLTIEVTRDYAFLDSQYLFSRQDNEFGVTATLLVVSSLLDDSLSTRTLLTRVLLGGSYTPERFRLSQSTCGEIITLTWNADVGVASYLLESSADGVVWTTYKADIGGGESSIKLDDIYNTDSYWRLTATAIDGGTGTTAHLHAVAPEVSLCNIVVTGCTLLPSDGTMRPGGRRRIQRNPVSVKENLCVAFDDTYLWISARYDYFLPTIGAGGPATTIAVTCPTPGATVLWATDGSDPTIEGPNDHTLPSGNFFGCIVKARAWLGDCYGPMTVILIDKRVDILDQCSTSGVGGSAAGGGTCTTISYYPVSNPTPPPDTICSGPHNTAGTYSGPGSAQSAAIAAAISGAPAFSTSQQILFGSTAITGGADGAGADTVDGGPGGMGAGPCYSDWQAPEIHVTAATFQANLCSFSRTSFWDLQQSDVSQVRCYVIGKLESYARAIGFAGVGGVATLIFNFLQDDMLLQQLIVCETPSPPVCFVFSGNYILEASQIVLTRDDDIAISGGFLHA